MSSKASALMLFAFKGATKLACIPIAAVHYFVIGNYYAYPDARMRMGDEDLEYKGQ